MRSETESDPPPFKETCTSETSTLHWLLRRTAGVRPAWILATVARIFNQLLLIAILICAGQAILTGRYSPWLWWILGLSLAKAALRYGEHFAGHWVAFTMLTRLRTEFYYALVPQAPAVTTGDAAAELSERATGDIDRIEVFFAHTVPPAIASLTVPIAAIVWSWFALGPASAGIMALASATMIAIPICARPLVRGSAQRVGATRAAIAVHLGDSLQGLREIRVFDAGERRLVQERALENMADAPLRRIRILAGMRAGLLMAVELGALVALVTVGLGHSVTIAVLSALVWVGLWAPVRGIDDFVDGLDDALASTERVRRTIDATPLVRDPHDSLSYRKTGDAQAEEESGERAREPEGNAAATILGSSAGGETTDHQDSPLARSGDLLTLENISFRYPHRTLNPGESAPSSNEEKVGAHSLSSRGPLEGSAVDFPHPDGFPHPVSSPHGVTGRGRLSFDKGEAVPRALASASAETVFVSTRPNVLAHVSTSVPRGQWSFIVGVSGSGKSTLAALIARGWDPQRGIIRYEGRDLKGFALGDLRSSVALVVQRPYLLRGSLADNLRLSSPEATDEQLWDALWAVDMDRWEVQQPQGLDHLISTEGANLSGGEIQRLAIARALVSAPELLVLDEATSQLDEDTALHVRHRIRERWPTLTVLEISHQVDRIPPHARVTVIDNGTVAEEGVAATLLSTPDSYLTRLAAR